AVFFNKAKNFITTRPYLDGRRFENTDKAETKGLELTVSYDIDSLGLTPYASAAYIRRKTTDIIDVVQLFPSRTDRREVFTTSDTGTPPFGGRVGVRWNKDLTEAMTFRSDFFMEWAVKAKQTYFDSDYVYDVHGTGTPATYDHAFVTDVHEAWQTFNVALGMDWGQEKNWHASFAVRNIFDQAYSRAHNSPTNLDPGFNVTASIGYEF
ncbi:MAG: TonB-dependent receptor, partial [Deltaproteobacteria bacterium]|nr:TonB-dependent receptor [Deltaproteobacteria bacterium]